MHLCQALPSDGGLLVLPVLGDQQGVQPDCSEQWGDDVSEHGAASADTCVKVLLPHVGQEVTGKHPVQPLEVGVDGHCEMGAG